MAIAFVQSSKGSLERVFGSQTVVTASVTVTSGNLLTIGIRGYGGGQAPNIASVTDTLGTTYTLRHTQTGTDPGMWIYSGVASSGGSNQVSVAFTSAGTASYLWVNCLEFSGQSASPFDAATGTTGSGTALSVGSITTADAGVLVAFGGQNDFTTFTAGTDFTLADGSIGVGPYGGSEYYVTSGALSSYTANMTSNTNAAWTFVVAAFHAATGGGGGGNPWYAYAQQRTKTTFERVWRKPGLIWTPDYALRKAA